MDFALLMLLALTGCGLIWGLDRWLAAPRRRREVARLNGQGATPEALQRAGKEPLLVEYARAFFPVILLVFLLRAFLVEPFRIPSGSMLPSLRIGDFILVNKYTYGLRLPVLNLKFLDIGEPRRGDVIVFRFPGDLSINYIKRVAGLPGDRISYRGKQLYVNGAPMAQSTTATNYVYSEGPEHAISARRLTERLDGVDHDILLIDRGPELPGFEYVVPEGHFFVLGDNRDRSNDSRFWGAVPEQNVVGRAFMIWFSWDFASGGSILWSRIGNSIR